MPMPNEVRPIRSSARGGLLWPAMFYSGVLDARCNVFVYTPPGVGRKGRALARLPVLYLLHGMWGSEIDWPFKGNVQAIMDREILAGRVPPMLVAMPHDGLANHGTFYSNWYDALAGKAGRGGHKLAAGQSGPRRRFEDYILSDLRKFVEVDLADAMRPRSRRLIAGLSMGGFGTLALSLRNPELFLAAASLSGATRPIGDWRHTELGQRIFGPLSSDPASHRRRHDPAVLVADPARGRAVSLYLDCGRSDFLLAMNRKLHGRLNRLGIDHAYHEYSGGHDWPSWRKRLPHVLRFMARQMSAARAG